MDTTSTLYEIEVHRPEVVPDDPGAYYHCTVVEGPYLPTGDVPDCVANYAELLARIVGPGTEYRVGWHRPVCLSDDGPSQGAWTNWLTDARVIVERGPVS